VGESKAVNDKAVVQGLCSRMPSNLDETREGFRCDAFFPDKVLSPHALAVGQKMMSGAMSGTIRVKLEVKTEDIVAIIVRTESGPESTLYTIE
jgi:hypothetical protein